MVDTALHIHQLLTSKIQHKTTKKMMLKHLAWLPS